MVAWGPSEKQQPMPLATAGFIPPPLTLSIAGNLLNSGPHDVSTLKFQPTTERDIFSELENDNTLLHSSTLVASTCKPFIKINKTPKFLFLFIVNVGLEWNGNDEVNVKKKKNYLLNYHHGWMKGQLTRLNTMKPRSRSTPSKLTVLAWPPK